MTRSRFFSVALAAMLALAALAPAPHVAAQATLTGTYIRYVSVGVDGTFIARTPTGEACPLFVCMTPDTECEDGTCVRGQSMQYGETSGPPVSCDTFYPGSPQESFTIEATVGGASVVLTNTGTDTRDAIETIFGPSVSGRTITWRGRGTRGGAVIDVEQTVSFDRDDRAVRVSVRLTNAGTSTLSDVFYLRNGDPDHGVCNIGSDFSTRNDVRRQPPTADSALTTAEGGDGTAPGRQIVLGIGAHDMRARVHNGGFANTDASGEWYSPRDGEGMLNDEGVDIVFREPTLAPGASTTFEFFYVWGTSVAEVESRFDELGFPAAPCAGVSEGGTCTAAGRTGRCRGGRCCTGCWDGTRCRSGTSGTDCGVGGAMCRSCADGDACTSDVCTAGVCSNPLAPRGTPCDDGLYCTLTDTCDGRGVCVGGGGTPCDDGASCTRDTCHEDTDSCTFEMIGGCIIGGVCVGEGTVNPLYACQVCDPARNPSDWSIRPAGTLCGRPRCAGGRFYPAGMCDAAGTCVSPPSMRCTTGRCADESACETTCEDTGCPDGEFCAPSGACEPLRDDGAVCTADAACRSGECTDGVCCEVACAGTCEACNLPGLAGICAPVPAGEDPEGECPGAAVCDGRGGCAGGDAGTAEGDAGARDAGARDAAPEDASSGDVDAGGRAPASRGGGCGCATPGGAGGAPLGLALAALSGLALAVRRRRGT